MGTTRSTVLLCRVTNQTIVCSQTGYGRGRERRSHIDPREHQQLITQIYVPIVHCLSERFSRTLARTIRWKRLAGRDRSGPAVGRLRAQREENDGATTRGDKRRTFEDRFDPVAYRRGECEKSRNRAGGPPADSSARYKYSPSFTLASFSLVAES